MLHSPVSSVVGLLKASADLRGYPSRRLATKIYEHPFLAVAADKKINLSALKKLVVNNSIIFDPVARGTFQIAAVSDKFHTSELAIETRSPVRYTFPEEEFRKE